LVRGEIAPWHDTAELQAALLLSLLLLA